MKMMITHLNIVLRSRICGITPQLTSPSHPL